PDRAVVARINSCLCVVFPAHGVLRGLAFHKRSLAQRQLAQRVVRASSRKSLSREVRRAAERVPNAYVAQPVNGRAGHPAESAIGRKSPLLMQADAAVFVDPYLVPAHAAAAGGCVDRVDSDDRFATRHPAIDEPRHDLVALRVESPIRARLRHAVRELSATQVMIRSHGDLFRAGDFRIGGILPINVELPDEDSVILEDIFQLRTAGRHYYVRRSARRRRLTVDVRVVQEIHSINDDALLGGRLALEHLRAFHNAGMLLDHVVARAGRDVVAVGPDRRARIIGEERPQKFVAIVWAERVGTGADRVAHRVRALRAGLLSALSALSARWLLTGLSGWARRRRKERNRRAWLTSLTGHANLRGIA